LIRKPVSIWRDHQLPHAALDMKLLDIGRNWNTLLYTSIQSIPNMLKWVTCLVSMQAMEELGRFQLPGIVYRYLQHGAVHYHAET
jgi:hypothetical protein